MMVMQPNSNEPIFPPTDIEVDPSLAQWSIGDTWLGLGVFAVVLLSSLLVRVFVVNVNTRLLLSMLYELAYLLPVTIVYAWRKISWRNLGFRKFNGSALGLGCGLLLVTYVFVFIHNLIMVALGVITQGDVIFKLFNDIKSPAMLFFLGIVMAPVVEEMLFRGFLFKGFRQRYGWKAAPILSSLIFGLSHLQLAAIIPTFLFGCVLAYVYHRTNSLFPGMILHFSINLWGLGVAFAILKLSAFYPIR
jgi:uncharacterized protein